MRRDQVFPSKYLGGADLRADDGSYRTFKLTILDVGMENVEEGSPDKPVMKFQGADKGMILNSTNWAICEMAYGEDSDDWRGKKVEVYFDQTVTFKGKVTGGVRMRTPQAVAPPPEEGEDVPF